MLYSQINIRIQPEKTPSATSSRCGPRKLLLPDPEEGATSQSVSRKRIYHRFSLITDASVEFPITHNQKNRT